MTIGSKFLNRMEQVRLEEAVSGKAKSFKFDRGTESAKRALRTIGGEKNFADKIAEVLNLLGVPGVFLNKPEVRASIVDAAQTLRTRAAQTAAFLTMHSALSAARNVVREGEEDLEGQGFQQLVEEVMVVLGLPEEYVTSEAKPAIKSGIRRTVAILKSDSAARAAVIYFARRAKIALHDSIVGYKKDAMAAAKKTKEPEEVQEAMVAQAAAEPAKPNTPQIKATNTENLAGHAIAMLKAMNLGLEKVPMAVRVLNRGPEQQALNKTVRENPALRAAVQLFATKSRAMK